MTAQPLLDFAGLTSLYRRSFGEVAQLVRARES